MKQRAHPFVLEPVIDGEGGITDMIHVGGRTYEVIQEHKNAWNPEAFRSRYSEVLERYDYILGDWGYSQLRLKGFFRDNHPKSTKESAVSSMMDYINEYCNFGCAYFILEKVSNKDARLRSGTDQGDEAEREGAAAVEDAGAEAVPQAQQGISLQPKTAANDASAEQTPKPASSERKPRQHRNRHKHGGKGNGAPNAHAQQRGPAESKESREAKEVRS
ncbi:YutD family protein [Paenibacillus apiarius]|uniref:YutD family protein n=1 Tax=Paenibacillus apiarius TaxID=46240 RepID=UPI001F09BBCA|nr:YutD family protein [Paenibacillus apiarius]